MRHILLAFGLLLLLPFCTFAQEEITDYKTISYTQLFDKIAAETDTVFRLSNHIIAYDEATDSLFGIESNIPKRKETLVVDKAIEFDNVQFLGVSRREQIGLFNIRFNKSVSIQSMLKIQIEHCEFMDDLIVDRRDGNPETWNYFKDNKTLRNPGLSFGENKFHSNTTLGYYVPLEGYDKFMANHYISDNTFILDKKNGGLLPRVTIDIGANDNFYFTRNVFNNKAYVSIWDQQSSNRIITDNDFNSSYFDYRIFESDGNDRLEFSRNIFQGVTFLLIDTFNPKYTLDYKQFNGSLINFQAYGDYRFSLGIGWNRASPLEQDQLRDSLTTEYLNGGRSTLLESFDREVRLRGMYYNHFKAQFNTSQANAAFVDMKDIETERYKYLYQQSPTFRTYFKWKINQFLELFVDYGTEPAKAIVMSLYVVLLFAFVYLFFPNHWDSHGKNRIKDRFLFFHKYLRLNKGIQDVYLEGQSEEIESSHAFRKVLDDHKDEVPAFFYNAAKPLLRWSTAGTTVYSQLLSRVDFLKGSWKETDPKVRGLKTALTIVIFIIALAYDMLIKMLNALMLSINTFTTLGFGEIPIKGLPRYLAIIQGFIGWFMLTIFSVSLISQLLN